MRLRVEETERWYRQSLAIAERLGDEHGQAITLHKLGRIAEERGNVAEAVQFYERAETLLPASTTHIAWTSCAPLAPAGTGVAPTTGSDGNAEGEKQGVNPKWIVGYGNGGGEPPLPPWGYSTLGCVEINLPALM